MTIVLNPSTATSPGEATAQRGAAATYEVRAHSSTCIADAYGFRQVQGDIQPVPTVPGNIQDADMDCIPGAAKTAIGFVDAAVTPLDITNTGYRQTLAHSRRSSMASLEFVIPIENGQV